MTIKKLKQYWNRSINSVTAKELNFPHFQDKMFDYSTRTLGTGRKNGKALFNPNKTKNVLWLGEIAKRVKIYHEKL
jgi:hypothetical protein